jgi:hypothetical protein
MFDDLANGAVWETDCLVAFYDITGFVTFTKGRSPAGMLTLYAGYLELTGTIVEDAANGIAALRHVQHIGDAWLRDQGGSGPAVFKAHWGTVAFSFVAAPDRKRLDAYGVTVDTTAVLNSREPGVSMTHPRSFGNSVLLDARLSKCPNRR